VLKEDPELNKDIKIIGVAVGNKPKQIKAYKKQFRVPFPVISDAKGEIWKTLGKPGTPTMLVCTTKGKVLAVHGGMIKDLDHFLSEIRELHKNQ
jgi:peroxiredoxin